ncbi:MAG: hypothetical protein LBK25_05590 [Treponema sp.]|jgi:hypothetical protein|nr:hypothetical protein [Treponema sp.]
MKTSDLIAIVAIFIALIVPSVQAIYSRKREWHDACQTLLDSLFSLYDDIDDLTKNPSKINHITFQYCLKRRLLLLTFYEQRFYLKKNKIEAARDVIFNDLLELPNESRYEKILNLGGEDNYLDRLEFTEKIKNYSIRASELLVK